MNKGEIIKLIEDGELSKAWHALGELLHKPKGGVTAQDDSPLPISGGHGGHEPTGG